MKSNEMMYGIYIFFLFHSRDYYKSLVTLRIVIQLTIYRNLEELMPSGVCSTKLQYDQVHKS